MFFAPDGSIKLYDSYLETLVQVLLPFVFEHEIQVTKNSGQLSIRSLPNLPELLAKSMASNDVFNFGSFVLSIVTDFHFDPILTVASGAADLNLDKISQLLMKKLDATVTKDNLRDFIGQCINPDEYQRTEFGMLLHHSFVLEWNARIVREIASQPNSLQGSSDEVDRYALAMMANDVEAQQAEDDERTANDGVLTSLPGPTRSNTDFSPMICLGKGLCFC